ncbi:DNA-3-methyladenine glycosylase [Flavobacterium sp. CS20]|uniref:DNA-3-methyladenine glycosylase n=1 Tax=Flavobacterium sp. CS20 TaxID=2775246 RepID=UPI001B39EBBC|nr:DNA-3-methyladenine glycosylase [Flavobacterium sp. CS20]QTY25921.1 DNA-3-methyladenine glycosylase [Flavobacterium sp. CS20]
MKRKKIKPKFFQSSDVVNIAQQLIGCRIFTLINDELTSGVITETEAYAGYGDKACHAHLGKFTNRTSVMYKPGGIAYIYLCYGIHHLFNVVTNTNGHADAILIRAFEPDKGLKTMKKRRQKTKFDKTLTSGTGNVSQALGLNLNHNQKSVCSKTIWFEKAKGNTADIVATTRVGVDYAGKDAKLPWRFYDQKSNFVSVKKK